MPITTIGLVTITDLGRDGAQVKFPRDTALNAAFRAKFPKARWAPLVTAELIAAIRGE